MTSSVKSLDSEPGFAPTLEYLPLIASYAFQTARSCFQFISWPIRSALSYSGLVLFWPFAFISSAFLYILAPFIVFLEVLFDIFLLTPYNLVVYLVDAVYPLYVFCGVACITGVVIGVVARWIVLGIIEIVQIDVVEEQPKRLVAPLKEEVKWEED
ncbi:hypothetical protein BT96DRAFT_924395 [Gymnopus androsaceus JB14]|uniref:Uncharacterized protein n=1 Tax=Gymnopus androsaceus JB14 TaxID=1447944 RepID=A0A6A4H5H4_9AGAR|nr:hypothetical protein BT96DRAFT_924395 [Gymnopus androsaceus JB14]